MRIVHHLEHCPPALRGCALALGNFDGIHLGHQALLKKTIQMATTLGIQPAVLTFEPHPISVLRPAATPFRLTPFHHKARLLRDIGIKVLYIARFNLAFSKIEATDFITGLLIGKLGARHLLTGRNFIFGHNRQGTTGLIEKLAEGAGFGYTELECLSEKGEVYSSSAVRRALEKADLATARRLLGRDPSIEGRVRQGKKLGRALGYPTANIFLKEQALPAYGIYCVSCEIEGTLATKHGVASLGMNPMYPATSPVLETHLFDFDQDLYGKRMNVRLMKYLRPEKKFDSAEALKIQMGMDCEHARHFFAE
jgi:riboflavin kinase/FMN adenylyltransferase